MATKSDKPDNEHEFHHITVTVFPAAGDLLYQLFAGASGSRKTGRRIRRSIGPGSDRPCSSRRERTATRKPS